MKIRGRESLPEVRDAGPVAVRRDPNDPGASAMTAAAGMSARAGEYIARGMHDLAAGIDKMARDRTEAGALAAYNDYVSRSSKLLYDADTGLMHAKGAGAEGLADRAYKAHKTLKDEIMHKLPAGQRKLFADRTASYDRSVGVSCMKHEGEQMSIYRQEEADRTLSTICTAAALDPDSFSMEAQEDAFREITIAKFGDQGAEANLKNSGLVRSAFFMGMIQQVAQSDPMRAEALVAEYGRYMEPADAQKLKISVEKAALPAKAQAEAQRLFEKYGVDGIAQALAEVREKYEGQEEDRYISYLNSYYTDKVQERNATYKQTRTSLTDTYLRTGALNGIDLRALVDEGKLDPEGALMWSERLKADQERRRAEAERTAARASYVRSQNARNAAISSVYSAAQSGNMSALAQSLNSLDERDFKKALKSMKLTPIGRQLLEASYKYGQDPKYFMDNYNDMLAGIADGSYDEDKLAEMKAYGKLTPIHAADAARLLKEKSRSQGAVTIKINYRQEFDKKMDALKIPEDQRNALRDRFNYDFEEKKRKNSGYVSIVDAGKMMDELLKPKVIGQTYSSWGTKKPVMVPAGLLPSETKWDADGTAYLTDDYENKHSVTVPGTPKLLPPRSEQEIYEEQQNRKNRFGGRM